MLRKLCCLGLILILLLSASALAEYEQPYACALRTGASYNYQLVNGKRRPSARELLRLQGFPDSFKIVVSQQEIRRQTGNSVAVPMIRAVAKRIDRELNAHE